MGLIYERDEKANVPPNETAAAAAVEGREGARERGETSHNGDSSGNSDRSRNVR